MVQLVAHLKYPLQSLCLCVFDQRTTTSNFGRCIKTAHYIKHVALIRNTMFMLVCIKICDPQNLSPNFQCKFNPWPVIFAFYGVQEKKRGHDEVGATSLTRSHCQPMQIWTCDPETGRSISHYPWLEMFPAPYLAGFTIGVPLNHIVGKPYVISMNPSISNAGWA